MLGSSEDAQQRMGVSKEDEEKIRVDMGMWDSAVWNRDLGRCALMGVSSRG